MPDLGLSWISLAGVRTRNLQLTATRNFSPFRTNENQPFRWEYLFPQLMPFLPDTEKSRRRIWHPHFIVGTADCEHFISTFLLSH
jgi:hypothetical protein